MNQRLLVAKRVLPQFWLLKSEVREYFLANAQSPADRGTLQTIELLCNARGVVQDLSVDDVRSLSQLLDQPRSLPLTVRNDIADYFENKGTRSWDKPDRRTVPNAWRNVTHKA